MRRGYKYRIYPTSEQSQAIARNVGCARFVYNALLDDYKQQLDRDGNASENLRGYFYRVVHRLYSIESILGSKKPPEPKPEWRTMNVESKHYSSPKHNVPFFTWGL